MSTVTSVHLSLKLNRNSILNCFGMQPVFVDDNFISESFQAFVYRVGNRRNITGRMHQLHKYRLGNENDVILQNAFHISQADKVVVDTLLNNRTFTFKQNASLDELMKKENHEKLKELLWMHLERIKYYTMMCKGNFIITSRVDLYNRRLFTNNEVRDFNIYLVSESLLPKNVLILGHSDYNSFRTPYVACPLFDKKHFDELCKMNKIDVNNFQINPKDRYPILEKHLNLYSLYQSYLDNVEVPYWYIETFENPPKNRQKAYYTTLFFD